MDISVWVDRRHETAFGHDLDSEYGARKSSGLQATKVSKSDQ